MTQAFYNLGDPLIKGGDRTQINFKPAKRGRSLPPCRKRKPVPRHMPYQKGTLDGFAQKVVLEKEYAADIRYLEGQLEEIKFIIHNIDATQYYLAKNMAELRKEIALLNTQLILSQPTPLSLSEQWGYDINKDFT